MPTAVNGGPFSQDVCGHPRGGTTLGRPGARGGAPSSVGEFPFRTPKGVRSFAIAGVSRDAQGNALASCAVLLYATGTDRLAAKVVSDSAGVFYFHVSDTTTTYYAVMFNAAGTLSGVTVNTLVGS